MNLVHPFTVRALKVCAVGSSLAYFVGVFLAFTPGWTRWSEHFVPLVLPYVWPPIMFVLLYMFARSNMGRMLLERQRLDEALAYSKAHWTPSFWWLTKAEALGHRAQAVRVLLRQGDYAQALEAIDVPDDWIKGKQAFDFARWAVELLLRTEDLVAAKAWEAKAQRGSGTPEARAALYAALAHAWARGNQTAEAQRLLKEAAWSKEDAPRVHQSLAWSVEPHRLFTLPEALFEDIPGQRAEWLLLCWQHASSHDHDPDAWLERLEQERLTHHPDQRSKHLIEAAGLDPLPSPTP